MDPAETMPRLVHPPCPAGAQVVERRSARPVDAGQPEHIHRAAVGKARPASSASTRPARAAATAPPAYPPPPSRRRGRRRPRCWTDSRSSATRRRLDGGGIARQHRIARFRGRGAQQMRRGLDCRFRRIERNASVQSGPNCAGTGCADPGGAGPGGAGNLEARRPSRRRDGRAAVTQAEHSRCGCSDAWSPCSVMAGPDRMCPSLPPAATTSTAVERRVSNRGRAS